MQENRNTFLNKIVGFHKYGSIHFIVLENILDSNLEIHRLYDLKGSTQGRINTTGAGPLKDLDLIKSEVYIELSDRNKLLFLDQILKDTKVFSLLPSSFPSSSPFSFLFLCLLHHLFFHPFCSLRFSFFHFCHFPCLQISSCEKLVAPSLYTCNSFALFEVRGKGGRRKGFSGLYLRG